MITLHRHLFYRLLNQVLFTDLYISGNASLMVIT